MKKISNLTFYVDFTIKSDLLFSVLNMADGVVKHGSNKEVQAVTFNLKQQRLLEKTLQTIELEESYAIKLLQLDDREVRLRQNNLKSRVSKIKSHLEPKDVKEIRELEMQGKLKPMYNSLNTNSALRIAATAKRLNMGPDGKPLKQKPRVKSGSVYNRRANTPSPRLLEKRCNSVTGVFIDADEKPVYSRERRNSLDTCATMSSKIDGLKSQSLPPTPRTSKASRPTTSDGFVGDTVVNKIPRAKTSAAMVHPTEHSHIDSNHDSNRNGQLSQQSNNSDSGYTTRETSTNSLSKSYPGRIVTRPLSQYGMHIDQSNAKSHGTKVLNRYRMSRRQSSFSLGSFDKEQAKERIQEAVQDRLDMQHLKSSEIQKKKKDFMKKVNSWVQENPSLVTNKDESYRAMADTKPTVKPPHLFGNRLSLGRHNEKVGSSDQWTDLKKCRYLRIPDNKVDYSGMNTLVRDQLTLFNSPLKRTIQEEQEVQ